MIEFLSQFWHWVVVAVDIFVAAVASGHVVLNKRDSRAACGWLGVIWLAPIVGTTLYLWLGINRIQRRAYRLRSRRVAPRTPNSTSTADWDGTASPSPCGHLLPLVHLVQRITDQPLFDRNLVKPLINGDEAFPAMLAAIETATSSITLCTYIFDNDRAGREFADALKRAADRGVEVRVLVDAVGSRYSWPSGTRLLAGSRVDVAKFLPTLTPWRFRYSNLRNHRKVLVIDGAIGFTGGMNIREGNYQDAGPQSIRDIHFQLEGRVVQQFQEAFALDWSFTTGELLEEDRWYQAQDSSGDVLARVISDGPDEDLDRLQYVIQGAITCAKSRITIVTPYFIPDYALISTLNMAALRGLVVEIVLPSQSNQRLVQWASMTILPQLLESGCRIWLSPPPFDHSKLMIVDGLWSLIGSANWDQRSLRLNFELDVECYDTDLASRLQSIADARIASSVRVTSDWLSSRGMLRRLRNGLARLASPYL
ncbi:MAG: cardiolipin synthase [Planctomycetota bacterium]|nr:cardiolipin synthase [Planctomycetota bacterium]